jgi:hypothetical protein
MHNLRVIYFNLLNFRGWRQFVPVCLGRIMVSYRLRGRARMVGSGVIGRREGEEGVGGGSSVIGESEGEWMRRWENSIRRSVIYGVD